MQTHDSVHTGSTRPADAVPPEWRPIASAPFDRDLELAVIDYDGAHALVVPCRRFLFGWIDSETKDPIDVDPSHWRQWDQPR